MILRKSSLAICSLISLGFLATGANAQYLGNLGNVMWGSVSTAADDIGEETNENVMRSVAKPPVSNDLADEAALSFQFSKKDSVSNQKQFVAKTRRVDPAGAADLERMFSSIDLMDAVSESIEPLGLQIDNVADAYAIWWLNAYDGSRGISREYTREQVAPVRQQAANALLATPGFVNASDKQKQETAEAYFVQAGLIVAYVKATQSDPSQLKKVQAAVLQGAKASGIDLETMVLTDRGFVPTPKRK